MQTSVDEDKYVGVEGGILEGFGKLFPDNTRLYVYPELDDDDKLRDFKDIEVAKNMRYLYQHLLENRYITGITCSDPALLEIYSRQVLAKLPDGPGGWQESVAEETAEHIMTKGLFGYRCA